ncbi:hypothetical protein D3C80_1555450 [compost metagenome]
MAADADFAVGHFKAQALFGGGDAQARFAPHAQFADVQLGDARRDQQRGVVGNLDLVEAEAAGARRQLEEAMGLHLHLALGQGKGSEQCSQQAELTHGRPPGRRGAECSAGGIRRRPATAGDPTRDGRAREAAN